jgi:hypothetical protein
MILLTYLLESLRENVAEYQNFDGDNGVREMHL